MQQPNWTELTAYRSRVRGCLLGGAIGDALGNPIEFLALRAIREKYGEAGITGLVPDYDGVLGRITDDTQMTLFTAEGRLHGYTRTRTRGIGGAEGMLVREAYQRWLDTQSYSAPPPANEARYRTGWLREEPWLYARRAPGNACLSGLREDHTPHPYAELTGAYGPVNPGSKGCGTVMRSAPFGFTKLGAEHAFVLAANCAQITHGHPTGYYAAGAFAALISRLIDGESPQDAVLRTLELLGRYSGHEETTAVLRKAFELAMDGEASAEKVEQLGAGWIAEEALAIAVYALLARTRPQVFQAGTGSTVSDPKPPRTPIEAAFLLSVNHSGDSDSTGAIFGNLIGAQYGDVMLPQHWLSRIEGRAVIATVADDFAAEICPGETRPWDY